AVHPTDAATGPPPPRPAATPADPFLRGPKRIRTDHAGVGLGLAIVKSITQAHDGPLTLTPRAAGGLRATVQLPAAPPHTAPELKSSRRGTNPRWRVATDEPVMELGGLYR